MNSADDNFLDHQVAPAAARGAEPLPPVSVHPHMVFGAGLTDPLDYLVLVHCMFLASAGRPFTVVDVIASLQSEGIRSGNGSGLVGRDAVRGSFRHLGAAGFIRRTQANQKGKFEPARFELYQHPVYNPDWAPTVTPQGASNRVNVQVTPQTALPSTARPALMGKTAGQTVDGIAVHGIAAPPTPPHREEEDSSSRKSSSTTAVTPGAPAAAAEFLSELPGRWACGRKSAAELAPLLAEAAAAQGWPLGSDLVQNLTRRSQARRSARAVLQERIEDLPRYRAARKALEQERSAVGLVPGQQPAVEDHGRSDVPALPDGVSAERIEQAQKFLLTLTGPWALGPESAARLAPLLAAKTTERGWEFDARLHAQLMSNPNGVNNYELVLERHRISGLPFRRNTTSGQRHEGQDARQKAIDACGVCDQWGQFERNGAAVLCKHDGPTVQNAAAASARPDAASEPGPGADGDSGPEPAERLTSLLATMRQPAL